MTEPDPNTKEIWKPIPGWEGTYEISSLARVRTKCTRISSAKGRVLKGGLSVKGYARIQLTVNGRRKYFSTHSLVALAFIGPRPDGMHINHRNGNKLDNRPYNLEYVTPKQNQQHASQFGLMAFGERHGTKRHPERVARGEKQGASKLTAADVVAIRNRAAAGETHRSIARAFGMAYSSITSIISRKNWKHVP